MLCSTPTPYLGSDWLQIQGLGIFRSCAPSFMRSNLRGKNSQHILVVFSLDSCLLVSGLRFAIDCSSHVSLHLSFHTTTISQDQLLIDATSIAIWSRNKVAKVATLSIWGIGMGFHIQCQLFPSSLLRMTFNYILIWFGNRCCAGGLPVFEYF